MLGFLSQFLTQARVLTHVFPLLLASMTTGIYIRTSVRPFLNLVFLFKKIDYSFAFNIQIIGNIFRKSLRLSGRARAEHSIGQITTLISKDATHLDAMSAFGHQ